MKGDSNRILDILTKAPATSYQVAVELDTDVQHACALLAHLRRTGVVASEHADIPTGGRPAQLWRLA